MNAAVAYRATLYGLDQPLGLPPGTTYRNNANVERGSWLPTPQQKALRRKTFIPVNWVEYKNHCAEQGATQAESIFDVPWDGDYEIEVPSICGQAWRIFTIYPYRDAVWVVKLLLTLGGSLMAVAATFGLVTAMRDDAATKSPALPPPAPLGFDIAFYTLITTDAGLVSLFLAGSLALVSILNAHRGAMEPIPDEKKTAGLEPPKAYKPALLGAGSWVWIPTGAEVKALWAKVPFRAGLVNWLGLLAFQVVIVDTFPGFLDLTDARLNQLAVRLPLFIGFVLLTIANLTLVVWMQEKWYKPKLGKASWLSAFLATLASFSLALSPVYQNYGFLLIAAWALFVGRWIFWLAIMIGFYDLMAFHPNAWAGISIYGKR